MIKYNDDNIYVGQIKELLKSFNLPVCKVKKDNSKFYVGEYYIDKDLGGLYKVDAINNDKTLKESTLIKSYKFNDEILNLTKHLEIRNNFYDSYTHTYLGNYLRFLRDYLDLDLMCMYNCFTNESPTNMNIDVYDRINSTSSYKYYYEISSNNPNYNIFMIPVKPNATYTLAFEYSGSFSMFYGFYSESRYLTPGEYASDNPASIEAQTFKTIGSGIRFAQPMIIKTPDLTTANEIKQISNFKLFLILPNSFTNNIVLLEGDYTKDTQLRITPNAQILGNNFFQFTQEKFEKRDGIWYFNDENTGVDATDYIYVKSCNIKNGKFYIEFSKANPNLVTTYESTAKEDGSVYDYVTRLQLLEYATGTKYLLADRLQEYLTDNVITHIDEVIDNIKRVQILLAGYDASFKFDNYGVWEDNINKWIYSYIATHGNSGDLSFRDIYRDVLCFVDKDIESVLDSLVLDPNNARQKKAIERLENLGGIYE